jgi:putative thiamine transport system substrate-binding protein
MSANAQNANWQATESAARGQSVYFNAWGGSEKINSYLAWVAAEVKQRYGITLHHVKLTDTVDAVKRVRSEVAAGKRQGGSVDLLWINGENFAKMKSEKLLLGPFAEQLPNFVYVDTEQKPTTRIDFGEPTDGFESPWGMAQFTFYADAQRVKRLPLSSAELAEFARMNPGRMTYPRPPAFIGTTFLKQALLELAPDKSIFYRPASPATFAVATAPLWAYLDSLHPNLWRGGKQFPPNPQNMRQLLADGELAIGMTFNPNEAANEVASKRLPQTTVSWQFENGTIGNSHFVAIPVNANAPDAAKVVANFLLSPLAQARKADIQIWGDPTVLAIDKLPVAERAQFSRSDVPGLVQKVRPVVSEPHSSWVDLIEQEWVKRYGK